jgi:nitrogen fixation/metabolism regulation signal transduction histidine kinase
MPKRSLKIKFIFYLISLVFFVALSFSLFFIYRFNSFIKEEMTSFGFHLAKDLANGSELAMAAEDPVLLQPFLEGTFEEQIVVLITIYNKRGQIISSKKKLEIDEEIPKNIMSALLREQKMLKRSCYARNGEEIYCFYSPVFRIEGLTTAFAKTEEITGFVRVGLSLDEIKHQTRETLLLAASISFSVIFFGAIILIFLVGNLIKPIETLRQGVKSIGQGNLDYRINITTKDEIEELANEFNQMTANLQESQEELKEAKTALEKKVKARTKELEKMAQSLEVKIEERTKELQKRLKELERFHRLTVGRELRMSELKKKIKKLEKELGKKESKKS